jgi:hypothetical protein
MAGEAGVEEAPPWRRVGPGSAVAGRARRFRSLRFIPRREASVHPLEQHLPRQLHPPITGRGTANSVQCPADGARSPRTQDPRNAGAGPDRGYEPGPASVPPSKKDGLLRWQRRQFPQQHAQRIWHEPPDQILIDVVDDAVEQKGIALREHGRRKLGGALRRQNEAKAELAALSGDPLEGLAAQVRSLCACANIGILAHEAVCFFENKNSRKRAAPGLEMTLQCFKNEARGNSNSDVQDIGRDKRKVKYR